MNLAAYSLPERAVNQLMACQRALARELLSDDNRFIVPLPVGAHLHVCSAEAAANQIFDFSRIHLGTSRLIARSLAEACARMLTGGQPGT